jgi:hypothetical protein
VHGADVWCASGVRVREGGWVGVRALSEVGAAVPLVQISVLQFPVVSASIFLVKLW